MAAVIKCGKTARPLLDHRFSSMDPIDKIVVRRQYRKDRGNRRGSGWSINDSRYFANAVIDALVSGPVGAMS